VTSQFPEWKQPGAVHSAPGADVSFFKRRTVFAKTQLDQVARLDIPVLWGQKIVNLSETDEEIVVTTANGQEYVGDVCIAANGLSSTIDDFKTATDVQVQDSGYAIARVALPRDTIKANSPATTLLKDVETQPQFRTYLVQDIHLILFLTKDWVAWAYTHNLSPLYRGIERH
jgi:environmental stress-induced protein Ves